MLTVMMYNVHLLLAVVFGMMLGESRRKIALKYCLFETLVHSVFYAMEHDFCEATLNITLFFYLPLNIYTICNDKITIKFKLQKYQ